MVSVLDKPQVDFSIVVPLLSASQPFLFRALASVRAQTITSWQVICVDDASGFTGADQIDTYCTSDPRFTFIRRSHTGGYAAAVNDALNHVSGKHVLVLHPQDELSDRAFQALAEALEADPQQDVLYSDEYLLDAHHQTIGELRKPDFSPERLRSQMYMGRLCAIERSLIVELRMREDFSGAEDYDLVLRATEKSRAIGHVREPLYGRRSVSAAAEFALTSSPESVTSSLRALMEHLERVEITGTPEWLSDQKTFRIRREIHGNPLVSIVIPTRGSKAIIRGKESCLVVDAVRGILDKSSYTNIEFVIVADQATPDDVIAELRNIAEKQIRIVSWNSSFNFSAKINKGAIFARGDYFLLLNDDVEIITNDWIEAMLGLAQQDGVGLVGALLYFEDGTVQHGGHVYSGGGAGHIGFGWASEFEGLPGSMAVEREVSGVTAACVLLPRKVFFEVGGFTLFLPSNFNDVDFCMKITGCGYKIIWTPHASLFHFESKSRISTVAEHEIVTIYGRWERRMAVDPFWPAS